MVMSFSPCEVPYLVSLQYPKQLYRYQLNQSDVSLYSVPYCSTSLVLPHCVHCTVVINRKTVERLDMRTGRQLEVLPDAPFPLSNAVVVPTCEGLLALWTNSRAFRLSFSTRLWSSTKSDVEKLPSLYCLLSSAKLVLLYAHTIWLTNRTSYFSEGTIEGKIFDIDKGESVAFALQLDLVGHFGCVEAGDGQVLLFGGYEEMRCGGSALLDSNCDLYLLDTATFQVKKVGSLPRKLEEPNLINRPVVYQNYVHCLSGRELLRIHLPSLSSHITRLSCLQTLNILRLLWLYERLRGRRTAVGQLPPCLVRETALYLSAVPRS